MGTIDVTPLEIRDYAISLGWALVKDALKEGLFVLNSPKEKYKQLIFPIEPTSTDYDNMAELAISKMATSENKSIFALFEEIREVNDDVISLRYYSDNKLVNSLSFQETIEAIEATKQMILAAGSSIVNPVLYHKRIARAEALELLKKTRFRHTKEGSFILKISCPVQLEGLPITNNLFAPEDGKPISRKAFELLNKAASQIINTVKEDTLYELLESQKLSNNPIISYNLCDSIIDLYDNERELPFEIGFAYSRAYQTKLPTLQLPTSIKFPYSFKSKLIELKNYFSPQHKDTFDTFFGSVESLNGSEGDDGRRAGEVILSLLIESEIVNAKVNLTPNYYDIAYKAHGKGGGLVKINGKLHPGKRIRTLDEINTFELVEK